MQFINYSNLDSPKMGKVSKEQLVNALLEHETKNKSRVDKLVEGLGEEVEFSTAISLFSNKLQATTTLSVVEKKEVIESTPEKTLTWESVLEKIEEMPTVAEMNEKSINKIQKEWNKVTAMLKDTVELWKSAEGKEKEDLLTQLKTLTISKNKLEAELDVAIGLKDADVELVGEATMQEIDKKVQKFVIKNANDYDYSNQDSAFQIYLSLKKLYPSLIKESVVTEAVKEVVISNMILNFLEERGVIKASDSQKIHKDLTSFLKKNLNESVVTEAKDDFMAKHSGTNITLKKGYKHHTEDELTDLYNKIGELVKDDLKVKDVTIVFESVVTGSVPSKEDLKAYINKNREEIDNLVDNDAWDKAYAMVLNDFSIESETPEGESMITLFNEIY